MFVAFASYVLGGEWWMLDDASQFRWFWKMSGLFDEIYDTFRSVSLLKKTDFLQQNEG